MYSITEQVIDTVSRLQLHPIFYGINGVLLLIALSSKIISRKNFGIAPNLDRYSVLFGVGVFLLAINGIWFLNGSAAVALVSALTAIVAIYRLRRPDETERPAVRQSFESIEDEEYMDFGLRNYGPEAALYLQVEAVLKSSGKSLFKFKPRDYPLHLSEGEFLGFIHDDRWPRQGFLEAITDIYGDGIPSEDKVDLYFSYVSTDGVREPIKWNNEPERPDKPIFEKLKESDKPRQIEVREIWIRCFNQSVEKCKAEKSGSTERPPIGTQ